MFQDEQQQAEEQAESISENFFDEVRQLIEKQLSGETASEIDYDLTTTEMFGNNRNPEEPRIIETTIPAEDEAPPKVELPRKCDILWPPYGGEWVLLLLLLLLTSLVCVY